MTQENLNALDHRLLTNWQCDRNTNAPAAIGNPRHAAGPAHRPGYGLFKAGLIFAAILSIYALFPWSAAHAGSPFGVEAGGYMYFSVPLMATEPQYEETALRFDLKGAGMNIVRLEMKQDESQPHFYHDRNQHNNWRSKRAELNHTAERTDFLPAKERVARTWKRRPHVRKTSARAEYLKLLSAYKAEPSRAERRRMYTRLIAAYDRAKTHH